MQKCDGRGQLKRRREQLTLHRFQGTSKSTNCQKACFRCLEKLKLGPAVHTWVALLFVRGGLDARFIFWLTHSASSLRSETCTGKSCKIYYGQEAPLHHSQTTIATQQDDISPTSLQFSKTYNKQINRMLFPVPCYREDMNPNIGSCMIYSSISSCISASYGDGRFLSQP
jgi:hypothetical protein